MNEDTLEEIKSRDADTVEPFQRPVNWLSVLASACVVLEATWLWLYPVSSEHPPSLLVLVLAMGSLFLGAGALIYHVNVRQHPIVGRWLAVIAMLAGVLIFSISALNVRKGLETLQYARMTKIVTACQRWAIRHHHTFPPDLSVLIRDGAISARTLSDPTINLVPLTLPTDYKTMKPAVLSAVISKNSDFRYTGAGIAHIDQPNRAPLLPRLIILFTNNQEPVKGGPLAFGDGKVRYVPGGEMISVLNRCNAARKQLNLPALNFDVMTTAATPPH